AASTPLSVATRTRDGGRLSIAGDRGRGDAVHAGVSLGGAVLDHRPGGDPPAVSVPAQFQLPPVALDAPVGDARFGGDVVEGLHARPAPGGVTVDVAQDVGRQVLS